MCGITGLAFADTTRTPDVDLVARMCAAIHHRGPDSSGGLIQPGIGLAARRLAVIDVAGGSQPIFNEDHSAAVVFNGEIYNYPELRSDLTQLGHRFRTGSDTETIIHLYEEYGHDFVDRLHGMFAIAIWDFRKQTLLLARDRLGVKPLYYWRTDNQLSFGSELKTLLQDPTLPRQLDPIGLHQLLTFGHILPPHTAFANIHELPPANLLVYQGGRCEIKPYWHLDFTATQSFDADADADLSQLEARIRQAVRCRLRSDVPQGAFLSGGIDSGIVVAMMSQLLDQPIKTFSIGFEDRDFSELPYAARVAKHCRTNHRELIVQPDIPEIIDELVAHHDAPFYDTSAIPTYYLSRFAREHVTVALSGDGGDEMFAGYNIFLANKAARLYQQMPSWLSRIAGPIANVIPESSKYINKGRVVREFIRGAPLEMLARYTRWATKIKRETRERLYQAPELLRALRQPDHSYLLPYLSVNNSSELSQLLGLTTLTELPADMLRKVDRMSMAHSLEVRSPLLDHTLFEYAATLPDDAKLRGWTTKYALRKLAKKLLPADVVDRPKRGFSIPLDRWLRSRFKGYVRDILFDSKTEKRGLFDRECVRSLANDHFAGNVSRGRELWTLTTIELWHRSYLDQFRYAVQQPERLHVVEPTHQGTLS